MNSFFCVRNNIQEVILSLKDEEVKILKTMACAIKPLDDFTLKDIGRKFNVKASGINTYKKKWQKQGILIEVSDIDLLSWGSSVIQPCVLLYLLIDTVKNDEVAFYVKKIPNSYSVYDKYLHNNRESIIDFIKGKKCNEITDPDTALFMGLIVSCFHFFEELKGIEDYLPPSLLAKLTEGFCQHYLNLYPIDVEWYERVFNRFSQLCSLTPEYKKIFNLYVAGKYLLGNKLSEAVAEAELSDSVGCFIQAVYYQKKDDYSSALKLYKKGISKQLFRTSYPQIPLFKYSYLLALINHGDSTSKTKLASLYNKAFELFEREEFLTYLLLLIANVDIEKIKDNLYPKKRIDALSLEGILESIVLKHYEIIDKIDEQKVVDCISEDCYSFIQIEASSTLRCYMDKYAEQTNYKPMLPPYSYEEPWLRVLNQMLESSVPAKRKKEKIADGIQTSRIVYLVSEWGDIIPKLQKSKDGRIWTKGRNIALKTFKDGIEEMSPFDNEMRPFVKEYNEYNGYGYPSYRYEIAGAKPLKKLSGHPLVFSQRNSELPIDISAEEPYLLISKQKGQFKIESNVKDIDSRSSLTFDWENDVRIKIMEITSQQRVIIKRLTSIPFFPVEAEDKIKALIDKLSSEITIHSDLIVASQAMEQVKGDAKIVIQLLPLGDGFKAEIFVKPFTTVAPYCKPGIGTKNVVAKIDGKSTQALRNFSAENKNYDKVAQALIKFDFVEVDLVMLDNVESGLEFLNITHTLGDCAVVEWPEGVKLKIRKQADVGNMWLKLKSKTNWFEVEGEMKVDDLSIGIFDLMQAFDEPKKRFIALGNEEFLALSDELRHIIQRLKALSIKDRKKLRISEFVAPFMTDMGDKGIHLQGDSAYKTLVKRIDEASKMEFKTPTKLKAELRDYQQEGFWWMARLNSWGAGACLADDMGLGKTVQTIAMLLHKATLGASLVVAPASVVMNWRDEINRFAPALNVRVLNSENNRNEVIDEIGEYDVLLTTYGLLVTEENLLNAKEWNVIVLDEAHTIKNRETKMSKAAMTLKGGFRLALTGTPIQNHLSEIWNIFQFMNPGLLGSFEHFQQTFIIPIEQNNNKTQQKELRKMIAPFLLRRTKNEVLQELPGKTEVVIKVNLSQDETLFYETLRQKAENAVSNNEMNSVQTLSEITKLRQAASHIGLIDDSYQAHSSKIIAFLELLGVMKENGHRALVFSQFTSHLSLLRQVLDKQGVDYLYLDGGTTIPQRQKLVKEFQTGDQPLFLISLKAGGLGLNLTEADFIVHLDPWWNPAIEDQASDRAYRIGQTRPVTVYRLIAQNTIEEKIIKLHTTKKDLANALLEGANLSHKLSREDILELLRV